MGSPMIPTLRYMDANRAIEFLQEAFGFEPHQVYRNEDGLVEHAELIYRDGMVMLGSHQQTAFGELLTTAAIAGKPTSSTYVVVEDVKSHAEQAEAAGARILLPVTAQDYGGSDYTCSDPEGNISASVTTTHGQQPRTILPGGLQPRPQGGPRCGRWDGRGRPRCSRRLNVSPSATHGFHM